MRTKNQLLRILRQNVSQLDMIELNTKARILLPLTAAAPTSQRTLGELPFSTPLELELLFYLVSSRSATAKNASFAGAGQPMRTNAASVGT